MISRSIRQAIENNLSGNKAIIILGPRQAGKTTLIRSILSITNTNALILNADDPTVLKLLDRPNTLQLQQIIGNNRIVFIDEAQRIPDIGITAKIIVDEFPNVRLILTGSSSFELAQQTQEPLTGRKCSYFLYPVSWHEWEQHIGFVKSEQDLENRLVFGFYPDVLNNPQNAANVLNELTDSYLYKDVLIFGNLKKPAEVSKLLQALAFQVGNEVSLRELSEIVGLDPKTIDKYIDVLEKAFVIFRLSAFSRNLRTEIKTNRKIYFYDNGIRNALIGQLQPIAVRQDVGALWENFLVSERLKWLHYSQIRANRYFWRTVRQQEIDYVEEQNGQISAYEFKWNPKRKVSFPTTFTETYNSTNFVIHRDNFRQFIATTSL